MWIALSDAIGEYGIKEVNAAYGNKRGSPAVVPNSLSIPPTSISKSAEAEEPSNAYGLSTDVIAEGGPMNGTTDASSIPSHVAHMVDLERQIASEAFKSSTRIAGLVRPDLFSILS